jgi:hypothetical protein
MNQACVLSIVSRRLVLTTWMYLRVVSFFLSRAPHAAALAQVLTGPRLTVGDLESMRDVDGGCRVISAGMLRRFLEGRTA